jgi:hypothetical protein
MLPPLPGEHPGPLSSFRPPPSALGPGEGSGDDRVQRLPPREVLGQGGGMRLANGQREGKIDP